MPPPSAGHAKINLFRPGALGKANAKAIGVVDRQFNGRPLAMTKAPLSTATTVRGNTHREREYVDKDGRHVQAVGKQFLCEAVVDNAHAEGERIDFGLIALNPTALGGSLALLADSFEQHHVNALRIEYCPTCPATTAGALAFYARNDTATPTIDTGLDELEHGATHDSFRQFQVWTAAAADVKPSDVMLQYFEDEEGDARFAFQGVLNIFAATALAAGTYGNFYLSYDITFSGEELDYEVADVDIANIAVKWNYNDDNHEFNQIFLNFVAGTPGAGAGAYAQFGYGAPSTTRIVFAATVSYVDPDQDILQWITAADPVARNIEVGQGFWIALGTYDVGTPNFTDESTWAYMYTNLSDALQALDQGALSGDYGPSGAEVSWTGTNHTGATPHVGAFSFKCRAIPVKESGSAQD